MTLQEIKQKIEVLSLEELDELAQYVAELQAQRRGKQIEPDVATGS